MQRLSLGVGTGELAEGVYRGLAVLKDKLVCKGAGDWERELQGRWAGEVAVGVWEDLGVEMETVEDWVFWFTFGDWHLEPQGGERGEVFVEVWKGLEVETEDMVTDWVLWLTIGD